MLRDLAKVVLGATMATGMIAGTQAILASSDKGIPTQASTQVEPKLDACIRACGAKIATYYVEAEKITEVRTVWQKMDAGVCENHKSQCLEIPQGVEVVRPVEKP